MPLHLDGKAFAALSTFGFLAAACAPAGQALAEDRYEIDAQHTHVQFSVLRFGFNDIIGTFPGVAGVITLDQGAPENSSVEATISVPSVVSGDETRDGHIQGAAWLNTEEFATMSFTSTAVALHGDNAATVTGDLTLLGVTRPVTLDVTLNKIGPDPATKKEAVGISATASINRLDWGMETAAKFVGTDVAIRIEALAHKVEE